MKYRIILSCLFAGCFLTAKANTKTDTPEVTGPEPKVVTPGRAFVDPPSDAIVLFNGKDLHEWVSGDDRSKPAKWIVHDGVVTVNKKAGDIQTKRKFTNYQLHLEWQ